MLRNRERRDEFFFAALEHARQREVLPTATLSLSNLTNALTETEQCVRLSPNHNERSRREVVASYYLTGCTAMATTADAWLETGGGSFPGEACRLGQSFPIPSSSTSPLPFRLPKNPPTLIRSLPFPIPQYSTIIVVYHHRRSTILPTPPFISASSHSAVRAGLEPLGEELSRRVVRQGEPFPSAKTGWTCGKLGGSWEKAARS